MTTERQNLIKAIADVGLLDFKTPEERETAHKLLIMMTENDAPKKRTRKSRPKHQDLHELKR